MNKEDKEELLKEIDRRLKVLRSEFIASLDDKKEVLVCLPEDGERLFFIDNVQSTISSKIFDINNMNDVKRFENGLFFETREEAKQQLKERKLLFKLKQWAKEKNDGWEPDWESIFQEKYYIFYDYYKKELCTSFNNSTGAINKLPYFKTRKIAQECIDLFGDEIIEVLC
jgi:hypothetical protein|nr:MAG TPA: recombination protein [Caudoviricetes sp.]